MCLPSSILTALFRFEKAREFGRQQGFTRLLERGRGFGLIDQLHPRSFEVHVDGAKTGSDRREAERGRRVFTLEVGASVMSDTYRTIEKPARSEHTVEGSRFLAEAMSVSDRPEVSRRIETIREREHTATHHCMGYRLGVEGDDARYDDDGEPSGTAGPPILRQIDARDLTNTLVVVTRYFGGTELGTGGLARAYGNAAAAALDRASLVERVVRTPVRLQFEYDDTSPAEQVLRQFDAEVQDSTYTDVTTLTVGVRQSEVDAFVEAFTDALSDRGELLRVGD
jgi:uncharacterized YigZ family protein